MAYTTIQEESVPLAQREILNVLSACAHAVDDAPGTRTNLYIGTDPAGTIRYTTSTTSPHSSFTGDVRLGTLGTHAVALGQVPVAGVRLTTVMPTKNADYGGGTGIEVRGTTTLSTGETGNALFGTPAYSIAAGSTGTIGTGLNFYFALQGGSTATVALAHALKVFASYYISFLGTVTEGAGLSIQSPLFFSSGSALVNLLHGADIQNVGHARVQTAYALRIREQSLATVANQTIREEGSPAGNAHGNRLRSNTQFGSLTGAFGTGDGVLGIANATTVPTTNPAAGGILYASAGALYWRGSAGTVTLIAPA